MTTDDSFLVVQWNIQFGLDVDGAIAALSDTAELQGPALLLLQEMDREGVAAIADALGHEFVYQSASVHPKTGRDFGNALLAPSGFERVEILPLPHGSGRQVTPRLAVWASTSLGGVPVAACSVHTETPALGLVKRGQQFEMVAARARALPTSAAVVIGGDFNTAGTRSTQLLKNTMAAADLDALSAGAGWGLRRGGRRFTLDHVFGRGLITVDCGVSRQVITSDHAPLWVRVAPTRR